jgi:hypothetical protein
MWVTVLKGVATSPPVKMAAKKVAVTVGTLVLGGAIGQAGERANAALSRRSDKQKAIDLARQVGGKFSERTIVAGIRRYVVWKNGTPMRSFPHFDGELASQPELQSLPPELLKDPPPP